MRRSNALARGDPGSYIPCIDPSRDLPGRPARLEQREEPMLLDSWKRSPQNRSAVHVRALALLWAGAIAIAAGASTACVTTGQYSQLQRERDELAARNEALKGDLEKATHDGITTEQEKHALAVEKTALEEQLANLRAQESTLNAKLSESDEEKLKLQATYDGLIKNLQKEMKAGQIEVTQMRDGLRVNVAQDILFDSGSAALDKSGTVVLGKVATQLKKSGHQILVIGHSDNKPIRRTLAKQYPSNWELAGARAASVVRLFAQTGLSSKRMLAVSVADSQPVASNKTEEGRAKNRRIEIRLRPFVPEGKG
jgi:chemotaxis protein MotB